MVDVTSVGSVVFQQWQFDADRCRSDAGQNIVTDPAIATR